MQRAIAAYVKIVLIASFPSCNVVYGLFLHMQNLAKIWISDYHCIFSHM